MIKKLRTQCHQRIMYSYKWNLSYVDWTFRIALLGRSNKGQHYEFCFCVDIYAYRYVWKRLLLLSLFSIFSLSFFFYWAQCWCLFKTSYFVAHAGFELRILCPNFLSAEIISMHSAQCQEYISFFLSLSLLLKITIFPFLFHSLFSLLFVFCFWSFPYQGKHR